MATPCKTGKVDYKNVYIITDEFYKTKPANFKL